MSHKILQSLILFLLLGLLFIWKPADVYAGPGGGPILPSPQVNSVTVPPCTSTSCQGTTTVVIDGQNFAIDSYVRAFGMTDKKYYEDGVIAGRTGSTQIIVDFPSLPCSQRYAVAVGNPAPTVGFTLNETLLFNPTNQCIVLNSINWTTNLASLTADNFYLEIDGQKYFANTTNTKVSTTSVLRDNQYITLESSWKENNVDLKFLTYFQLYQGNWKNFRMSVYNGKKNEWFGSGSGIHNKVTAECSGKVTDCGGKIGVPLSMPVVSMGVNQKGTAIVHFENLRLVAFNPPASLLTPEIVFPKNGQTLDLEGAYMFKVKPIQDSTGYLFSFIQNGVVVYDNLRDAKKLSSNGEFALWPNNSFHNKFVAGNVKVVIKALVKGEWTNSREISINLKPRKPVFSKLSAEFSADVVNFYFTYSSQSSNYRVDISKNRNMSSPVSINFAQGSRVNSANKANLSVPNPTTKWKDYKCGQVYYWRISNNERSIYSLIQTAVSSCARG